MWLIIQTLKFFLAKTAPLRTEVVIHFLSSFIDIQNNTAVYLNLPRTTPI